MNEVFANERKIWWLASYPKSGNTWVRMFLNAYMSGFPLDINSGFQYASGDNNPGYFQSVYCRPVTELTHPEQIYIRPAALMTAISLSACKHVCLKTHHAKVKVDDIPLFPPKVSAGGVYIIRDPRDIAISFADHLDSSIDETIAHMNEMEYVNEHSDSHLIHVLTTWSIHVDTWTVKNKDIPVTVIKYEDMLRRPEHEFTRILKALGVEKIDNRRLRFALEQTTFKNLQQLETNNGFRELGKGRKFFRKGKANQWKKILTSEQIETIEQDHGEVMKRYGYRFQREQYENTNPMGCNTAAKVG